jgi:hypothetical protein
MPTYAILGATGQTGQSILSILLDSHRAEQVTIHAYVRSKTKLLQQTPSLETYPNVKIFEGGLNDIRRLAACIAPPVTAVFSCVATNENTPGCSIALDTAHSIITALNLLRTTDPTVELPRILVLSAAPINDKLCRETPRLARWLLLTCLDNIYSDLARAEKYYRLHSDWMIATFVQPAGLVHDKQVGHAISTEREQSFLSFLDLAAGMIEIAEKGGEWDWEGVAVIPTGKTRVNFVAPFTLARAAVWTFLPWLYWICARLGLV